MGDATKSLLSATAALVLASTATSASAGPSVQVAGLMCTEYEPMMNLIDVANTSSDQVAQLYKDEDLPRMPNCGMVADQVSVTLEESLGTFELTQDEHHVMRVTAEATGNTMFLILRTMDMPEEALPADL